MQKNIIALSAITLFLLGCGGLTFIQPIPAPTIEPTWTISPLPTPTVTDTAQPTLSPTETFTPFPSDTPPPTFTFIPTSTDLPQWTIQGPNEVNIPILLYHHIGTSPSNSYSPYYVSAYAFEQQMYLLHEWGYQTISVEMLITAIQVGTLLPQRPIILTFDDGSESVYSTALPIMHKYNFTGTIYLVNNYIGAPNFLNVENVRELYEAGWEVGSHSIMHTDLTLQSVDQEKEIIESRLRLNRQLDDIPVLTFAYPFGAYNVDSVYFVRYAGYIGAVGLGASTLQGYNNLYYLYRRGIDGTYDLKTFASFLPWQEDINNLPILTIVP